MTRSRSSPLRTPSSSIKWAERNDSLSLGRGSGRGSLSNLQLFVGCVAIWGSTWLAITYQLGRVAAEASVSYRFFLASALIFGYCVARRLPLRYPPREHLWIALFGILMFSVSYIFVYYAEEHVVSGLVAVGYSASPLLGLVGMRVFFGTPMTGKIGRAHV